MLEGAIQPALGDVVEHVRKGTLDFLLLKPVDAQFMVSTARFEPWRASNVWLGLGLFAWAFHALGRGPTWRASALAVALLVGGAWPSSTRSPSWSSSLAFFVVKVDNLIYLFISVYDAARWPVSIFRGALAFVFTFVIPLAVMTTFPALALLGRLSMVHGALAVAGGTAFAVVARRVWLRSIRHYTSAGG